MEDLQKKEIMPDEKTKILLIEDNLGDARLISEYLKDAERFQYEIDHSFRLSTGLDKLHEKEFDIILLDLGLPDSGGLDSIEKIFEVTTSVPIIILTGHEDETLAINAVKLGAQDYLIKLQVESNLLTRAIRYAIERKKTAERLAESEDHYRSLFEKNRSVMLLIDSETGDIVDVNAAACEFYGYQREEFLRLHISEINTFSREDISEKLRLAFSRVQSQFEFHHRLKNGVIKDVEVFSGPICKGNKKFLYSIVHDISERKRAENALKDSEYRYKTLFESAGDAIFIHDLEGHFLEVNGIACRRLGYSREELLKMTPADIDIPEEAVYISNRVMELKLNGQGFFTTGHVSRDGKVIPTELSSRIIDYFGKPAILSIARDISVRKQAESEILKALEKERELNDLKSRFVSIISHEYRTPLTSILSSTELLEMFGHKWTEEKRLEHLAKIKKSVNYMTEMLNDVLLINRADAGRLEFTPDQVEIISLCNEMIRDIQSSTRSKCQIRFESDFQTLDILMDKKLIRYILNNLLINAVHYSPASSVVKLCLKLEQETVMFEVSDQGIGIPQEDYQRLFEPFYRGRNISNVPGTGLGLSIVKKCVELHNGQISFNSTLGTGTTFIVKLPVGKLSHMGKQKMELRTSQS